MSVRVCVCVRALQRGTCAPPPSSRMWLKSEAEQRRADRFIMRKWNCSDNDDNCGGRTAPGGRWGCVTGSLIDGREMMCVSGGVRKMDVKGIGRGAECKNSILEKKKKKMFERFSLLTALEPLKV